MRVNSRGAEGHRGPRRVSSGLASVGCGLLVLFAAVGCTEDEGESAPPSRSSSFERTDRIFIDNDDDPACFNADGSNNNVGGDLTRSVRQEAGATQRFGPLTAGDTCSTNSKTYAGGYYARTDMPATMGEWCVRYGFAPDCRTTDMGRSDEDLQITYFNAHALPVFRVTLCNNETVTDAQGRPIIDGQTGRGVACVNLNFICPERVAGGLKTDANGQVASGVTLAEARCDPTVDANCKACEAVSVTMHYDIPVGGTEPTIMFGAYRGVEADAPLMDRIDLNFDGVESPFEVIPNICNNCHGGRAYEPTDFANPTVEDVTLDAQLLPINPRFALRDRDVLLNFYDGVAGIDFTRDALMNAAPLTGPLPVRDDGTVDVEGLIVGGATPLRFDLSADMDDAYAINRLILKTNPLPGNRTTLEALDRFTATPTAIPLAHEAADVPLGWQGVPLAFYSLVAEHCTDSCHLALPGELGLQRFDEFIGYRKNTFNDMCRDYSMPQSPEAFNLFWSKSSRVGAASRGDDVERFLRFSTAGWDALETLGDCPIPPLAFGAALGVPEFVSPLVFEKKRAACIIEIAGEKARGTPKLNADNRDGGLIRNCEALCSTVVLTSGFDQSAALNRAACAALRDEHGLVVPAL